MSDDKIQSPLSDADKREVWGEWADNEEQHLQEVEQRWGDSQAYAQTANRVARYGKREWEEINADNASIEGRIRELMDAGCDPTSTEAMDAAEAQRVHVSRWFYDMSHDFHVLKSQLYVDDPRYRAGIEDNTRPGAAEWLQTAIKANAARAAAASRTPGA
ncbi:TipAS antibiotic-recognition domain-containing protein [Nonomuraea sp. NPDC050310]|uniref:TipAS antibiotic-recognition domain-containing protein n=1 Tax=Nonomuraea sp. NPDC050310 TaxID=3154935 RepID=UPI0033C06BE2